MTKVKTTMRGILWMLLVSVLAAQAVRAQCENKTGFAKKACEIENASGKAQIDASALDGFKGAALTTN